MLYITYESSSFDEGRNIKNIWQSDDKELLEKYKQFMLDSAKKQNIVINPHWLNGMNYEDHNTHLTREDYIHKLKIWNKYLRNWTFDTFISQICRGIKLEHVDINL